MRHIDEFIATIKPIETWYLETEKLKDFCRDIPVSEIATDAMELIDQCNQDWHNDLVIDVRGLTEGVKALLEIIIEKDVNCIITDQKFHIVRE